ncbi:MBL fold metallo-hydrolase [Alkalihalobacillus sp. AL-G]|uniref:YtnP family quorum-quenching lactonase n=1 Tax=Alkalihalobacillus sp. AL-G TaxID=2926399 RepID=UPI00272ADDCC|nr:MBL fold metallo-hydrolase [Alkalihalobacillus sp. AL-G]WLD92417.1 MBL fold metallo-hydrolase [Alkalihalobacillus sp. AL-G]
METLQIGDNKLHWLNGGVTHMDGGAMFGVVPKPLWENKYPHNEKNQIELRSDPIFFQYEGKNILIESGIGNDKFNEKQIRNYGITEQSSIDKELEKLDLTTDDIDIVLMTHLHFDHACGLTKPNGDKFGSTFKNAIIYTSETEWNEMRNPNIRSKNTYWEMNWKGIESQIQTFKEEVEVLPGLKMVHTGGHSDGHSILQFTQENESYVHMADLMPTHAHLNALWVLAYDDYPMTSIAQKQKWISKAISDGAWFTFYHDAIYRAVKFNSNGEITDSVKRQR